MGNMVFLSNNSLAGIKQLVSNLIFSLVSSHNLKRFAFGFGDFEHLSVRCSVLRLCQGKIMLIQLVIFLSLRFSKPSLYPRQYLVTRVGRQKGMTFIASQCREELRINPVSIRFLFPLASCHVQRSSSSRMLLPLFAFVDNICGW